MISEDVPVVVIEIISVLVTAPNVKISGERRVMLPPVLTAETSVLDATSALIFPAARIVTAFVLLTKGIPPEVVTPPTLVIVAELSVPTPAVSKFSGYSNVKSLASPAIKTSPPFATVEDVLILLPASLNHISLPERLFTFKEISPPIPIVLDVSKAKFDDDVRSIVPFAVKFKDPLLAVADAVMICPNPEK